MSSFLFYFFGAKDIFFMKKNVHIMYKCDLIMRESIAENFAIDVFVSVLKNKGK